ncbi:MAG: DUF4238 domain-containing protein [Reyranella sp.]|uniref:DUF4238 domain-containing protein n=1 Tax=Reyranella sp. TaxID=1929291 RepID=UPI0025F96A6C|nr:DUF4238 domain-containing protein [Reyranella sp.]MBR2818183.1 DUF4238 domain-containing protein [Reyranella sp.]
MGKQEPRDHHYAPQFYLRNFAIDPERRKIATVAKNGHVAVWSQRSIAGLGYERDFYVHLRNGVPVSVETAINRRVETPLSASETWRKITAGHAGDLVQSDRPILYALIRHLQARTPHALETMRKLVEMAASPNSKIPFSAQEREMYAAVRASSGGHKAYMNAMAARLDWALEDFESCGISIFRSPIPLKASTTPVLSIKTPSHPALKLPLPGMTPYTFVLPLDPHTLATLTIGDFDGAFVNRAITTQEAKGFNQQYVGQFAYFDTIRHLITTREGLIEAMTWAPYDLVEEDHRKVVFRRRQPSA